MRISDWSSDVCSSDLAGRAQAGRARARGAPPEAGRGDGPPARRGGAGEGGAVQEGDGGAEAVRARAPRGARAAQIGRASCRERVCQYVRISVVAVSLKKNKSKNDQRKQLET